MPDDITIVWRDRIPKELEKEIVSLREYDPIIRDALEDPRINRRFLNHPTDVLDSLKIPISPELRKRLNSPNGMDKFIASRRIRLPGNQVICHDLDMQITGRRVIRKPTQPEGKTILYDWQNPFTGLFKPTGLMNHGFPVVYEITKSCIQSLLSQWFDRKALSDMIENLKEKVENPVLKAMITIADLLYDGFEFDLNIGAPSDVTSNYQDLFTLTLRIPRPDPTKNTPAVSVLLCITASVVVDHTSAQHEEFYMDITHCLAYCKAEFTFTNVPLHEEPIVLDLSSAFEQILQSKFPKLTIFPDVPVDRSGTNKLTPMQFDIRIIDDTSSADCDAIALLLSFADMGPGDRSAFTHSFVSSGSGLLIDFNWLRTKILPQIEAALGLPTAIDPKTGEWSGKVPIANGDGANLIFLALGVLPGSREITVIVTASKEDFCHTAYVTMSATLKLYVEDGILHFNPPVFQLLSESADIPWECYVMSVLIGGALGPLVAGSLGGLVGSIVAPLLLYNLDTIAASVVEGVIANVNSTIQGNTVDIQKIDLGVFKSVLQNASVDDLIVLHNVDICDSIPALSEATVFIPDGGCLDIVTGQVAPIIGTFGHLAWGSMGSSRMLMTVGTTELALVGNFNPEYVTRYRLYHCTFNTTQRLPLSQLASLRGSQYEPNALVYAVRTNDGHYARFTVTAIADDGLWLHYKTYPRQVGEKATVPTIEICGRFEARQAHTIPSKQEGTFQSLAGTGIKRWGTWFDANSHWFNHGDFYVNSFGFQAPLSVRWKIQGQALSGTIGNLEINGARVQYEISGWKLGLTVDPIVIMPIEIEADVTDATGRPGKATLIAHTVQGSLRPQQTIPSFDVYIEAYKRHVGPWIEVDPESISDQGYRIDHVEVQ